MIELGKSRSRKTIRCYPLGENDRLLKSTVYLISPGCIAHDSTVRFFVDTQMHSAWGLQIIKLIAVLHNEIVLLVMLYLL